METIKFILPETWASYLINRDESGYSGEELDQIKDFL